MKDAYATGAFINGFLVFVISYIYCIFSYGFLFGLGLGWLPSLILAFIAGLIWPLVAIGAAVVGFFIFWALTK